MIQKSTSLKYQPSLELLRITAEQLFSNRKLYRDSLVIESSPSVGKVEVSTSDTFRPACTVVCQAGYSISLYLPLLADKASRGDNPSVFSAGVGPAAGHFFFVSFVFLCV